MYKIAAVVVTYKDPKVKLEKLEKALVEEGLQKKDVFFRVNDTENVGYGDGINRIIQKHLPAYDYFLILNPDIEIKKGFLSELLKAFTQKKFLGIVGPKILDEKGNIWSLGGELEKNRYSGGLLGYGRKDHKEKGLASVDFVSGTAMLVRKEVFEKIGLFAKDYFLYYEDVDFCLRTREAGWDCIINPEAEIIHFASSTTGKDSPLMQYYLSRNHLLLVERFAPIRVKLRELVRLPKTLYESRAFETLGIRDYFLRRFGKNDRWS